MSGQNSIGIYVQPNTNNVGIGTTAPRTMFHVQGGNTIVVNGNVGIGTTIPLQSLHVVGDILTTGTLKASNISAIGDFVTLNTITSNTEQVVVTNAGTGPALKVTQTGAEAIAEFFDDGISALKIADGGNVGIGTTNPQATLHVNGNIFSSSGLKSFAFYTITGSYSANTWYNIFNAGAIPTGIYLLRAYLNTFFYGGSMYEETHSGMFSWFSSGTNSDVADTISTHRSGHAPNDEIVSFRTQRSTSTAGTHLRFQFSSNRTWTNLASPNFTVTLYRLA